MGRVAVTGLGFVTCLGNDRATVSSALHDLRHGIEVYEPFAGLPVTVAAPVRGFDTREEDPEDWEHPGTLDLRPEQLRSLAPHGLYAMYAVEQALAEAGWSAPVKSNPRTGLYTASVGSARRLYESMARLKKLGPARANPLGIVSSVAGTLTFNLAAYHKILGYSGGFVSACASSGHALGFAHDAIALGRQDRMLVVGAEDFNAETTLSFLSMRVLSVCPDPEVASRPFDKARDGFVGTGGAVAMTLESEAAVEARGGRVLAYFEGWGQASDGHHVAITHPEGAGLERAMREALASSGVAPEAVDYVNAHATSTPLGDAAEAKALTRLFGSGRVKPYVSSTKALTGHGLSLSSILEAAFCVLAIEEGYTPGSAHIAELDESAQGLRVPRETIEERPGLVLSNSSGFGGANVSLVFRAPESAR